MCQNPYRLLVFKNKKQYVLEKIRQQLHSHYCIDVFLKMTKQVIFFKESSTVWHLHARRFYTQLRT